MGLVVKERGRWKLDTENIRDVVRKHEETEKRRKRIEEVKKELEV